VSGVRAELLEQQVHELNKYIQLPEDWIKEVADQAGDESEMNNLRRQRDRLESETLDMILSKIIPGGVWYFNELLPVDFPGHWLYHAMPATWAWVKKNSLSLHTFYNLLQVECSEIKIKRHVYSQPISHEAAQDVLQKKPGVVQAVSEEALAPAIARLEELGPLKAEFTIIEGWEKKQ
jgi:hypothetical protein